MYAIAIILLVFLLMEGLTWVTHRYVMHGLLWVLHRDHHKKEHNHFLERNDWFFVIFAIPSMILIGIGNYIPDYRTMLYIGIGITCYGFAYFVVHEIIIHQRFKLFTRSKNFYIRAIRKAHKMHHKHLGKEDGECFGMLWVPFHYFKEAWRTRH
jgi:beta-carotene 3-hydroxylase